MIRSLMLFAHVVGMLTLFAGLGVERVSLYGIQRSMTRRSFAMAAVGDDPPSHLWSRLGNYRRLGSLPWCAGRRAWE
jgi:hypothetical protein